jgi:hypothetical protein
VSTNAAAAARAHVGKEPAGARRAKRPAATPASRGADVAVSFDRLQHAAGNRAVDALVRSQSAIGLQRKCACTASGSPCPRCAKARLQRRRADERALDEIPPIVGDVLAASGQALDPATRAFMEARFDHDFSGVRVHADSRAADSAQAVNAHAYTVGSHVVFATGRFSGTTGPGRELLAHELAHVVQQTRAGTSPIGESPQSEAEADRAARLVAGGDRAPALGAAPGTLARKPKAEAPPSVKRMTVVQAPGSVVAMFDGMPVLTVAYNAAAGTARVDHYHDHEGAESVFIVTPPGSDARATRNMGGAPGVTFSEVEPETEDGFTEVSGYTFQLLGPPAKPAPKPSPPPAPPPPPVHQAKKPEEEKEKPPELPDKSAEELIDEHTTANFLDEEALGAELLKYALSGDPARVQATLTALGSTDRDDVARAFMEAAKEEDLAKIAETEEGRRLLARLKTELTAGYMGGDEEAQSERINQAIVANRDPEIVLEEIKTAPIIPFSSVGWTKLSSASIDAELLDNGKIRVKSFMKPEHWQHAKNVSTLFASHLETMEFYPDQMVGLHLIDEGGKQVYVPAIQLLQMSNQEDTKLWTMAGEGVITGVTLGSGGAVIAGGEATAAAATTRGALWLGRAATVLKWGDRIATGAGIVNTLVNDHRGLIIQHFGKEYVDAWAKVEFVLQMYAIGRGAIALGQTGNALRATLKDYKARRAAMKLSPADEKALDDVVRETEKALDDIDAQIAAGKAKGTISGDALGAPSPHALVDDVTAETKQLFEKKPGLKKALQENPRAAAALKKCQSPCFPPYATEDQIKRLDKLLADAEADGYVLDRKLLADHLRSIDRDPGLKTAAQKQQALDNLINSLGDVKDDLDVKGAARNVPGAGEHVEPGEFTGGEQRGRHLRTSEYDPTIGDSTRLGENLRSAARPKPGPGYQAHHIIPSNEGPQELRDLLKKHQLDLNGEHNGSWLPTGKQTANLGAEFKHEFVTSSPEYFARLKRILDTDPPLGKDEFVRRLRAIGEYLQKGELPPPNLGVKK